jgi:Phospholipase_D-nuclease N-terminal
MIDSSFWYSQIGTAILVICWLSSLYLVLRLWFVRHADPASRKIFWSVVLLLLPVLGWILYAGFYKAPKPVGNGHHQYSGLG